MLHELQPAVLAHPWPAGRQGVGSNPVTDMALELSFTVAGPPVGKKRARITRNGAFTPKATVDYEERVSAFAWEARRRWERENMRPWPLDATYSMHVSMYFGDRRGRDFDNVIKSVTDATQVKRVKGVVVGEKSALWANDTQVKAGSWIVGYDKANPRIHVRVAVLDE